jgi:hypothetical protein
MANENFETVRMAFNENGTWDNMYCDFADTHDGETYVIFDDWNSLNKFVKEVKSVLGIPEENKDYEIERELDVSFVFSDEYTTCSDCNHIIRTSPTHYGWQPDFYIGDGFIVCGECFRGESDYQEAYIEERINNPKNALQGDLITEDNLQELGFAKFNTDSYESGLHYGQNDDPEKIYNNLKENYEDVLFKITSTGQFDIDFDVWVRGE